MITLVLIVKRARYWDFWGKRRGKTTLMNVLYGLYPPSSGKILLDGKGGTDRFSLEAISYGVGMVHQHFKLVDTLSVIENVISASPPKNRNWTWNLPGKKFLEVCKEYELYVDPMRLLASASRQAAVGGNPESSVQGL